MKKSLAALFCVAALPGLFSCVKDPEMFEQPGSNIEVQLSSASFDTKSSDDTKEIIATYMLSDEGDKPLYLHLYRSRNTDLPFITEPKTKGSVVTASTLSSEGMAFTLEGYLGEGRATDDPVHFVNGEAVTYTSGKWVTENSYLWRSGVPTSFWSYYPAKGSTINGSRVITLPGDTDAQDAISFTYSLPTPAASSPFNDAKNQQDLLFAYSAKTWTKGQTGIIDVMFEHPLAAVRFDVSGVASAFGVTNVAFKNILSSGTCEASFSDSTTVFSWSDLATKKTFSQDYTAEDLEDGLLSFDTSDKVFFFVPQALQSDAEIQVTFTPASGQTTLTEQVKSLPINTLPDPANPGASLDAEWEAGYVYTYELSYDPFTYSFGLQVEADSLKTFTNTSRNSAETIIPVTSKRTFTGQTPADHDWEIVSYQIGSSTPLPFIQAKLEAAGGLSVVKDGNNIKVVSVKRDSLDRGSHDYWVNKAGRTDNLDWSPADWTTRTASAPIDLSRFDFSTDMATVDMNTANCYIVRHPGTYKIPLVYGNAITQGQHNAASFQGMSGSNDALNGFRNSADKVISNGLIENNTTNGAALAANRSNAIKATAANVLWQDNAKVIKDVKLVGDPISSTTSQFYTTDPSSANADRYVRYVQFTVDNETVCQNNAVITVEVASGILWSWHIWVTNDPAVLASAIPVKNHTNYTYDFFPVTCLGWVEPKKYLEREDVTLTLRQKDSGLETTVVVKQPGAETNTDGTHYQWGRKDPFPQKGLPNSPSLAEGTIYTQGSAGVTFAKSIQQPNYFYTTNADEQCWWNYVGTTQTYYNLWMGLTSTLGALDKNDNIIKTVYDPCPPGYMVPPSAAFTGFTKDGTSTNKNVNNISVANIVSADDMDTKHGMEFYTQGWKTGPTIYFHRSGYHAYTDGSLSFDANGYYLLSGNDSWNAAYRLRFYKEWVNPNYAGCRAYGFAVRPVKESDYVPTQAPASYAFNLVNGSDASQTFTNTSAKSSEKTIPVNSKKTVEGQAPTNHDWDIVSYKIGESDYVDYDKDGLEAAAGLTVVKDGNNIKVTSLARKPILKGSHQYWLNGGTANDWSPADWTTSTAAAPIDLSKFDFATDTKNAHPMHTANCYVIRHAGTYKFPLVYGNAVIPDGTSVKANTYAYNPGLTDTDVLSRFLDYNGHGITNPFIENNTTDGKAKSASNSYLKVTGASVKWQDKASVITNVKIVDGSNSPSTSGNPYTASSVRYVQFTVNNTTVCQNNAVITVTDASGNIVWSWHIWVTNDPGLKSSSIPVTNTKGTFNFFPVPCLGWIEPPYYPEMDDITLELVQNDSGKKAYVKVMRPEVHDPGNGTYYQYGRKDPMPAKDGISGSFTKNTTKLEDGVSLASGIKWPHHFWARKFDIGDWLADTYYNLWTGTMKSTSLNATAGRKTVYDPSPVGYRVPVPAAFAGFCDESGQCEDTTKWNVTDTDMSRLKGYTFKTGNSSTPTIFFPAAGYRTYLDGTLDRLGLNAYFGTAIPKAKEEGSGYYAYGFGFSANYMWTQDYFVRADGLSIRPMKE